ncbi:MAG: RNA polymerase sigma factor [Cyclobacteriaceae bacterium]|nr:RNA polymerase sigma factor [Cyclobacteriaceae bacterium]
MPATEPEIIKKAAAGDRSAFRQLAETHQRFVYAVAVRVLNNPQDAEDATQETFIRLWKNLNRYKPGVKLTTWLYRIVTNICLDMLKSAHYKRNRMTIDIAKTVDQVHTTGGNHALQQADLMKAIENAVAELPHLQKVIFVLRDLQGLSPLEVSQILETTEDKIKSNLYHARIAIGKYLKQRYQTQNITEL